MASGGKLVVLAALGGNLAIAVTKFAAALIAGSSSMLTEGIHSTVDTLNEVLLLYGRHRAAEPPDERHPLGHSRELYFWAFVVALLIFTGGAGMSIFEGVRHLQANEMPTQPRVNYAVLAASFVFESISLSFAVREFLRTKNPYSGWLEAIEQSKDPTVFVVLMEDAAALAGLTVAGLFIGLALLTGHAQWDGMGSIVIGLLLAGVAALLGRECKKLLIGEEARPELRERLRATADHHSGVCRVNDVVTVHLGPQDVIAMMNLDFEDDLPLSEVERIIEDIEQVVTADFSEIRWFYVRPQSCEAARARREAVRREIVDEWAD
ncbi:MAG TPA: cation diffusion facilitator family transporter [Croceibacterium sp.]|nr:cation diffusion facilitator family transporter [Croceibacterium sp.]